MKKILALGSLLFIAVSCTNESTEDVTSNNEQVSMHSKASKTALNPIIVTLNTDPIMPVCYSPTVDNKNLQIQISQPAPYDISFQLSLKQKSGSSYLSVPNPWVMVVIPKGETWATIDTACQLETYVPCGNVVEIRTGNFRLAVTSAKYFYHSGETSDPLEYEFNNGINSIDFTFKKACQGEVWTPGGPQ